MKWHRVQDTRRLMQILASKLIVMDWKEGMETGATAMNKVARRVSIACINCMPLDCVR